VVVLKLKAVGLLWKDGKFIEDNTIKVITKGYHPPAISNPSFRLSGSIYRHKG